MLQITLPGRNKTLEMEYLLLDLNGTITFDGVLIDGVQERIKLLKEKMSVYLLTADTMGKGQSAADQLGIEMFKVSGEHGGLDKRDFLHTLGTEETVAIGNGYNDVLMLQDAGLSIVIIGNEGCSTEALKKSDITVNNINDALDLLLKPLRLVATLRG